MSEILFILTFLCGLFFGVILTAAAAFVIEYNDKCMHDLEERRAKRYEELKNHEYPFNLINPDSVK